MNGVYVLLLVLLVGAGCFLALWCFEESRYQEELGSVDEFSGWRETLR